jgi:hypothetical protein
VTELLKDDSYEHRQDIGGQTPGRSRDLREFGMTLWYMRTILACMLALFVVAHAERDGEER